jgi:hypothetical protein
MIGLPGRGMAVPRTRYMPASDVRGRDGSACGRDAHAACAGLPDGAAAGSMVWPADRIVVIDDYGIAQEPEDQEGMSDV